MPLLGKIISRSEAENEIKTFLEIRKACYSPVMNVVNTISSALPQAAEFFGSEKISFVFERSVIEQLLQSAGSTCNGIRIYVGAAPNNESNPPVLKGSPTLLIVPCTITPDPDFSVQNIVPANGDDPAAVQWPGAVVSDISNTTINLAQDTASKVIY